MQRDQCKASIYEVLCAVRKSSAATNLIPSGGHRPLAAPEGPWANTVALYPEMTPSTSAGGWQGTRLPADRRKEDREMHTPTRVGHLAVWRGQVCGACKRPAPSGHGQGPPQWQPAQPRHEPHPSPAAAWTTLSPTVRPQ